MMSAVLSNPNHPKYGVATIPFPIPRDQYTYCMDLLEALEIGDAVKADCKVEAVDSFFSVLKRTEMLTVNVEELNYLAKRLDSFDTGEAAQFQAMAHKLELFELKDLINLTFCCQQATVITDFSDLAAIGRDHYMNLHGGSASVDELNALDGKETARQLIENGGGTITPYGVVYDNGMKLEQVYDGRFFPCYYYEPNAITVAVTSKAEPEDTEHITWLFLPLVQEEIDRSLLRGGITDPADVRLRRALEIAGIDRHPHPKQLRGVCVHCLRHTFAVHTLQLQSKRGIDRFYSVPILSTYMGHTDIYGTELYLRLTPECYEHIVDCAEKDTGDIFPEVLP